MIDLSSLTVMLLSQLFIAFLLLVVVYLVWTLRCRGQEQADLRRFILRFKKGESRNQLRIGERLRLVPALDESQLLPVLDEYGMQEKRLYRQVFDLILRRNLKELNALDQRLGALIAPLLELLASQPGNGQARTGDAPLLESLQAELENARRVIGEQTAHIQQIKEETTRLSEQLSTALETLEEVSGEYSKMFGSSQNSEELAFSLQRMRNLFHETESRLRQAETLSPEPSSVDGANA
jgi:hypothetical protein